MKRRESERHVIIIFFISNKNNNNKVAADLKACFTCTGLGALAQIRSFGYSNLSISIIGCSTQC